jgi:serine kinase of HPr protein (carbohydrate metabolism regulator)
VYALCSGSEREERRESMQNFLDELVRSSKTVMTRAELGGTLFLVAVIGVLLTSREEGGKSE